MTQNTVSNNVLVVDDDPFVRDVVEEILLSHQYIVYTAKNGREALDIYTSHPNIDIVISDINMDEMDGIQFIDEFRRRGADIPVIILTNNTDISTALEAIKKGASDYLLKDENIHDTVLFSVNQALDKYYLQKQNIKLMKALEKTNNELREKNTELMELNQLKNKFLGIAAHDLRGPLSGIIGLSGILLEKHIQMPSDRVDECVKMIHTTAKNMLQLVNELLDISVIESGKLELKPQKGSLRKLISDRIRMNKIQADNKNLTIQVNFEDIPDCWFDPIRIAQVFDNLMSNAIKYSPRDTQITIGICQEKDKIKVSVQDQGPGISPDDQDRVFGEFQKLSARPTGGESSTGLGLAIAKKMIEAHHGSIHVESIAGKGANFYFLLPIQN